MIGYSSNADSLQQGISPTSTTHNFLGNKTQRRTEDTNEIISDP